MTRYIKLLVLALFAAIAVALPSCSDGSDSPNSYPSKIVGSWKRTVDFGDGWTVDQYVQFKPDGKYVMVGVDNYYYSVDVSTGSWSIDGNKLVIKPDDTGGFFDSENLTVKVYQRLFSGFFARQHTRQLEANYRLRRTKRRR